MRLEKLTIKGLLAFEEAVTLDLRAIPAGSIIAVVGANGSGKSTLMDAAVASLYRALPSRAKSIYDYAHAGGGAIDAEWDIGGVPVTTRQEFNPTRRTSKAVVLSGGGPLTDGKAETFEEWVRTHCPPLDVVLASAFAAQNGQGSFRTLKRTGRKDLFVELLGLQRFDGWRERAFDRRIIADTRVEKMTDALDRIEKSILDLRLLLSGREDLDEERKGHAEKLEGQTAILQQARRAAEAARLRDSEITAARNLHTVWGVETNRLTDLVLTQADRIDETTAAIVDEEAPRRRPGPATGAGYEGARGADEAATGRQRHLRTGRGRACESPFAQQPDRHGLGASRQAPRRTPSCPAEPRAAG